MNPKFYKLQGELLTQGVLDALRDRPMRREGLARTLNTNQDALDWVLHYMQQNGSVQAISGWFMLDNHKSN